MAEFSFSENQVATLRCAVDRIVPADEFAGAAEAGVAEFIVGLLRRDLAGEQASYREGLDGIERESVAIYGKAFVNLPAEQQDAVLTKIEENRVQTDWVVTPGAFFQMLVEHVLEGFYADPGNGGNRDMVSWKMIGYRAEGGTW